MTPEELGFCLDGVAEVIINSLISAIKADPQILEALKELAEAEYE